MNHNRSKTGHCPWSGKESERSRTQVRDYLDSLPPDFDHPTRGTPAWMTPQNRSRKAVAARATERG